MSTCYRLFERMILRMRNVKEISAKLEPRPNSVPLRLASDTLLSELESNGVVVLPHLVSPEQLQSMQVAFEARLQNLRWNNVDGYQKTELYRHMVEDILLLDQGFLDVALHPLVKKILTSYLGPNYELTESKGWKSLPTNRDFHGWHGDAWYDQSTETEIHREIKLGIYLTDVRSGAFNYIKGSHGRQHPRLVKHGELSDLLPSQLVELTGPAGTAFLFDTSGIHRQGLPMLEPRQAVFYNYHDPRVRLQQEDINYYRYHPLLLNAAFLGALSTEDQRVLGFCNKINFQPAFRRHARIPMGYKALNSVFNAQLRMRDLRLRISARLRRALRPIS